MAVGGIAHIGGHAGGHHDSIHHGGHHDGGHHHHGHDAPHDGAIHTARSTVLSLASPRVLFGLLLGFGATGVALHPVLSGVLLLFCAVLGALVLELGILAPLWRFFFRFASNPAQTLDASILSEARATSGFNADGEGLVAVEVDGHVVQCLGTLRPEDRSLGVRVRSGDVLRVESVDSARQRCTVSYVRHGASEA